MPVVELVGAWFAGEQYAIVGGAAAENHGLTLDSPSIVEIQLARAKREVIKFQGKTYRFLRSKPASVHADNVIVERGDLRISIASPPKLLVLLLNQSRRGPATDRDSRLAIEVLDRGARLAMWRSVRWDNIVRTHGTSATARRLGFLLERLGQGGWERLLPLRGRAGYTSFSALHDAQGDVNAKWRLRLNDPVLERLDESSHT